MCLTFSSAQFSSVEDVCELEALTGTKSARLTHTVLLVRVYFVSFYFILICHLKRRADECGKLHLRPAENEETAPLLNPSACY